MYSIQVNQKTTNNEKQTIETAECISHATQITAVVDFILLQNMYVCNITGISV